MQNQIKTLLDKKNWRILVIAQVVFLGALLGYSTFEPEAFDRSVFFRIVFIFQILLFALVLRVYFIYANRRAPSVATRAVEERSRVEAQDFVAQLSHEMRTPLTSIMGFVETVEYDLKRADYSQLSPSLQIIKESSRKLHNLCENLLILSRENQPNSSLQRDRIDADVMIRREISFFKKQLMEKEIEVAFRIEAPMLKARKSLFGQVFENLVSNAIRHSPLSGVITLSCLPHDEGVVFVVEDQGEGVTQDNIEKIFDPFFRADTEGSAKGFGLGLTIVRKILFLHGGRVWVESSVGQGTRFHCLFPN